MLNYYSQMDYISGMYPCLVVPIALFIFAALVLVIMLWVVSFAVVFFVEWFQYELSCILQFLGHEGLEFDGLGKLWDVVYVESVILVAFADASLYLYLYLFEP